MFTDETKREGLGADALHVIARTARRRARVVESDRPLLEQAYGLKVSSRPTLALIRGGRNETAWDTLR